MNKVEKEIKKFVDFVLEEVEKAFNTKVDVIKEVCQQKTDKLPDEMFNRGCNAGVNLSKDALKDIIESLKKKDKPWYEEG